MQRHSWLLYIIRWRNFESYTNPLSNTYEPSSFFVIEECDSEEHPSEIESLQEKEEEKYIPSKNQMGTYLHLWESNHFQNRHTKCLFGNFENFRLFRWELPHPDQNATQSKIENFGKMQTRKLKFY